jgi:predicted flavoprotein YhiN
VKYYPRGEKELRGPFHQFCSGDTIEWFEKHGVELKIEDDGRMFPVTDSSQTIIDCFLSEAKKYGVEVLMNQSVKSIEKQHQIFHIETSQGLFSSEKLFLC